MAAGRPRAFDVNEALDKAMNVFWRKGYEGASMPELTSAMGISSPSLYAAFGSKEALFRRVLDQYELGPSAYVANALKAPTARRMVEQMLRGAVNLLSDENNPRGCLMVQGALSCGVATEAVRNELTARRAAGEVAIYRRLKLAKVDGDLPAESSPAGLARYIRTVIYGMAVQAAGGATRKELSNVVDMALLAWPISQKAHGKGSVNRPGG
jgi:AcrR family transcriptional regulator